MSSNSFYRDHWVNIDEDRLERYQRMFQGNPASDILYEPADIQPGQIVGDFGSDPGHTAIEIARWVGSKGHVHALDINPEFVEQTKHNAKAAGLEQQVTAHQCDGCTLPFADEALDRLTTRNTVIYVDDPEHTIREFWRVLRIGGIVHAIEGDWPMMVIEPVAAKDWKALVDAASHACRTPNIGRKLYGLMVNAGFSGLDVQVITRADTDGRLLPMIKNMAEYAHASGRFSERAVEEIVASIEAAIEQGNYLALAPQFVVTARR